MYDQRIKIKKAIMALNEASLLPYKIPTDGIELLPGDEFVAGVNDFLDSVEQIPSAMEGIIPDITLSMYNDIVNGLITFPELTVSPQIRDINFKREVKNV